MSRRSRRKTLSHADLEDFLCDLGQDANLIVDSMDVVDCKTDCNLKSTYDTAFSTEQTLMSDEQRVRQFCKVINLIQEKPLNRMEQMIIREEAIIDIQCHLIILHI